jgi:hypothetical protein
VGEMWKPALRRPSASILFLIFFFDFCERCYARSRADPHWPLRRAPARVHTTLHTVFLRLVMDSRPPTRATYIFYMCGNISCILYVVLCALPEC